MQARYPDILNEIRDLATEVEQLAASLARKPDLDGFDPVARWERAHTLASATEKVYTGCERVMSRIAADIDQVPVSQDRAWHIALLKRMSNEVAGRRAAIISASVYEQLDRLRSFRHRERNSYGIALDAAVVLERAKEAVVAFAAFREEVERFIADADPSDENSSERPPM